MVRRLNGRKLNGRLVLLALAVTAAHGCVADGVAELMTESAASFNGQAMPARMEVAYVKDMALTAPPAVAPVPAPPAVQTAPPAPVRRAAAAPRRAASAPDDEATAALAMAADAANSAASAPAPLPGNEAGALTTDVLAEPNGMVPGNVAESGATSATATPASSPSSPTAAASRDGAASANLGTAPALPGASGGVFSWPASTRMSYVLTGNYRGEINGSAQVEWIRQDERYQVHLDIQVGLPFAPLLSRKMSSEGRLSTEGLQPERYDEESKLMFRAPRRVSMRFEPDTVVLANGQRFERWPGVQDTASQFVQMTYLFTTQPGLLRPGSTVELPLALPRNIDRWVYDVLEPEILQTPFGPVDTFHLKPRRLARSSNDLSAEIWFAPQLQYLPVRIRITQDAETHIDLMISRRPQLAAQ